MGVGMRAVVVGVFAFLGTCGGDGEALVIARRGRHRVHGTLRVASLITLNHASLISDRLRANCF